MTQAREQRSRDLVTEVIRTGQTADLVLAEMRIIRRTVFRNLSLGILFLLGGQKLVPTAPWALQKVDRSDVAVVRVCNPSSKFQQVRESGVN